MVHLCEVKQSSFPQKSIRNQNKRILIRFLVITHRHSSESVSSWCSWLSLFTLQAEKKIIMLFFMFLAVYAELSLARMLLCTQNIRLIPALLFLLVCHPFRVYPSCPSAQNTQYQAVCRHRNQKQHLLAFTVIRLTLPFKSLGYLLGYFTYF